MDGKKSGSLVISLKKSEHITIGDGDHWIEIFITDKYKQPLYCKAIIKSSKLYNIKRKTKINNHLGEE